VLVPSHQSKEARQIVDDYYAGKFEASDEDYSDAEDSSQG
jgi:hypothetical protein